jgi:hypothetical protein
MKGLIVVMLGALAIGCGSSSGGGGGSSGVSSGKRLDSLSDAEKASFCDWANAKLGGYGKSMDCGNGTSIPADDSQADCVAQAPTSCAATVAQAEACLNAQSCSNLIPSQCTFLLDGSCQ